MAILLLCANLEWGFVSIGRGSGVYLGRTTAEWTRELASDNENPSDVFAALNRLEGVRTGQHLIETLDSRPHTTYSSYKRVWGLMPNRIQRRMARPFPVEQWRNNVLSLLPSLEAQDRTNATTKVVRLVTSSNPYERVDAISTLGRLGIKTPETIGALASVLKSGPQNETITASFALVELDPTNQVLASTLHHWLGRTNGSERLRAIQILGRVGAAAKSELPVLRDLRDEQDPAISNAAEDAVRQIESALENQRQNRNGNGA